jgi:hypothetical protein
MGISENVRDVPPVEAHAFGNFDLVLDRLAFLDSDDALFTDLFHCVRDELADMRIAVGRNGGNGSDLSGSRNGTLVLV